MAPCIIDLLQKLEVWGQYQTWGNS